MGCRSQPRFHNPCREPTWPRYAICFPRSGIKGHRDPIESLSFLLDPALRFDLHIFDHHLNQEDFLPDRYQTAVKGSLDDEEMLTAYRCYDVMLNANSTPQSSTMFSRHVVESLACGTPVVTTQSTGMSQMLGRHINITRCVGETVNHLNVLLSDKEIRDRKGHLAYRHCPRTSHLSASRGRTVE